MNQEAYIMAKKILIISISREKTATIEAVTGLGKGKHRFKQQDVLFELS